MEESVDTDKKKKILIVEDDSAERELYEEMLKNQYDILKAKNGEKALEKISSEINLIMLDRKMPGLTGDQVLEKIRNNEDPKIREIPTIMLTALNADLDIINMGFDDYLNKPVSPKQLREKIQETLSLNKYSQNLNDYFSLVNKKNTLQDSLPEKELTENEKYQKLIKQIEEKRKQIDEEITDIMEKIPVDATDEFQKLLKNIVE